MEAADESHPEESVAHPAGHEAAPRSRRAAAAERVGAFRGHAKWLADRATVGVGLYLAIALYLALPARTLHGLLRRR